MNDDKKESRVRELKAFRNKANQLASIHSKLSDEYNFWHSIISSTLLLISSILIGLTFISDDFVQRSTGLSPDLKQWVVGIISILNFSGVLLLSKWDFQGRGVDHRNAMRFYFAIVNRIRQWLDSGIELTDEMIEEVRTEYSRTQALPKIPDARFLKLKQWHLQKVAISKELDEVPFESINSIKRRLSNKTQEETA